MMLRNTTVAALLVALLPALTAQQATPAARVAAAPAPQGKSQEELIRLRSEKLAKPVFQKAPWVMDFDKARAQAKAEGKLLFTYFTRSYAG